MVQSQSTGDVMKRAFLAAWPHTVPIFAGFWFLGAAYGVYMNALGFSFLYPTLMALIIFGGSLEFVAAAMLLSPFAPVQALIMAFIIQSRHLFYGIAMLDRFKGMGLKKPYLIFGMCDETFSINYTADIPDGVDRGWFYFLVTLLNQFYWVSGAMIGGLAGSLLAFDTSGIEFVMTAMFVVILMEQWKKERTHVTGWIGFAISLVCLYIFGSDSFVVPTIIGILAALTVLRRPIGRRLDRGEDSVPREERGK